MPYGINGSWTLLNASCKPCADITHRFERDTLQNLLPTIRTVLAMQSRRARPRPASMPLVIERGRSRETIDVPLRDFPLYLPSPILPAWREIPSPWDADEMSMEIQFRKIAGPTFQEVAKRYDATFVGSRITFSFEDFARTIAKIGYCAGVFAMGIEPFRQSPIRSYILGDASNPASHVGSWKGEPLNIEGLHAMEVRSSGTEIHAIVQLFAQFGAPCYHVFLGPAANEYAASAEWPWKS